MTTKHAIATVGALFLFGAQTSGVAAQTTCNAPLGWWESQGLEPVFSNPPPDGATDCDFQIWSWTAFVHWMQNDPETGQPMLLSLPTPADLQAGDADADVGPRPLALQPRFQKPRAMGEIEQASGGVLIDQNGRVVYYATHMEPIYFNFTQEYYGPENYQNAEPTLEYPVGATVFKTAWRIVPEGETMSGAYTTTATLDLLESDGEGGLQPSGETQSGVTVALVGVHVVGVVEDHPEFLWATFEQVDNVPDLPAGMEPSSSDPVSSESFTFYAGGTPANESNHPAKTLSIDTGTQVVSPITNVFREYPYGGAAQSRVTDIMQSNANFQGAISEPANPAIDPVFANYRLNGTVWIEAGTLQPGDGKIDYEAIASVNLASSVMETFVQNMIPGGPGNCFTCHNTSGHGDYPGKNINFSHVLMNSLEGTSP